MVKQMVKQIINKTITKGRSVKFDEEKNLDPVSALVGPMIDELRTVKVIRTVASMRIFG